MAAAVPGHGCARRVHDVLGVRAGDRSTARPRACGGDRVRRVVLAARAVRRSCRVASRGTAPMTALLVALGACVGAPLRLLVSRAVPDENGTLVVNVLGSLLLGLFA